MKPIAYFFSALVVLILAACSSVSTPPVTTRPSNLGYQAVSWSSVPAWQQAEVNGSLTALKESCRVLSRQAPWQATCQAVGGISEKNPAAVRQFFTDYFQAWTVPNQTGTVTGYYEPLLNGARQYSTRTPYPIYGVPRDMWVIPVTKQDRQQSTIYVRLGQNNRGAVVRNGATGSDYILRPAQFKFDTHGNSLKARIQGRDLLPYYTRQEISQGRGVDSAPILAYVEDPVELFFLQIQGSGRIQLEDGTMLRLGFAERNGYPYQSIGRYLVQQGEMTMADASMQGIKKWVKNNPSRMNSLFNVNPSYVFFRDLGQGEGGPLGALGVPLTSEYSVAVDKSYIPLGAPLLLKTTWPASQQPLQRVVLAQDTGSAIKGPARIDLFWGYGTMPGMYAGRMKQTGQVWLLLPKGLTPP